MKYVLLFCGTPEDQAAFDGMSQEDLADRYAQVGRWLARSRERISSSRGRTRPRCGSRAATRSLRMGRFWRAMS
jgi:hypothetical protein